MSEPQDRRLPDDGSGSGSESGSGSGPGSGGVPPWDPADRPADPPSDRPATGGWQSPGPSASGPAPATPGGPTGPPRTPPPAGDPWGFGGPVSSPRPGIVPLRPLALGELLDGAFQYIRAHPKVVLGVSAVVAVVTTLIQAPFQALYGQSLETFVGPAGTTPDLARLSGLVGGASALLGVSAVVGLLANTVLTGLLVVVLSRSVLGAPVDARECWSAARPRLPGLLGVVVLVALVSLVAFAVFLLPAGLAYLAGATTLAAGLGVLGILVGAAATLVVSVLLALAAPAYVLEGIGVVAALSRSRRLVTGRFWPILGTLLLTYVIVLIIASIIGIPFGGGAAAVAAAMGTSPYAFVPLLITSIGSVIGTALTAPFQAGVTGLLYIDQRMRREGFDIELQRAAHGLA
ncbi:hypothetical protein GCM10023201_29670 [Actinomycetospora corticicola]|uniref:Glycerophosphoryl diester phosphodiesterase family protein n=1 Tax=Actinomycetospora corticicola TaxID=663602 RepID=A0A7Y9DU85_9PSEU|nr:hypothetical protein [Actinomycetospora corticicola]NYD35489.1 hypothetical protein [Actinomycetospora corticicola]